jgi:Patatin-like phospholipase
MLRALSEAGIVPDAVVGTSVGAINGAFVAADPAGAAAWLARAWEGEALQHAFSETIFGQVARLARSGTHLHSIAHLAGPVTRRRARMIPPNLLSAEVRVLLVSTAKPASLSHAFIWPCRRRWTWTFMGCPP